jgi:hypothetical protein
VALGVVEGLTTAGTKGPRRQGVASREQEWGRKIAGDMGVWIKHQLEPAGLFAR